jgi:hypothetical protein
MKKKQDVSKIILAIAALITAFGSIIGKISWDNHHRRPEHKIERIILNHQDSLDIARRRIQF